MAYDPWADIAVRHPGVHVERCDMRPASGAWVAEHQVILLDRGLLRAERNSTLAHEVAHIDLEHAITGLRWFDRRQERDADAAAARRLLPLEDLAAVLAWALSAVDVARELDVTAHMVNVRLRGLSEVEKHTIEQMITMKGERSA